MTNKKKQHVRYVPTLTNEQIMEMPIYPQRQGRWHLEVTDKGKAYVSRIWHNPFGAPR